MIARQYSTGQFAHKAGVTLRTLRFYDKVGLLRPSAVTDSGHRRYSDRDLIRLQQILALKFLGFSLEEIRNMVSDGSLQLQDTLALQKQMMVEKRGQIEGAIGAIESLLAALAAGWEPDWQLLTQVIKATQMEQQNRDAWKKYYSEEARRKVEERAKGYSQEQAWADARRWQEVLDGMKAAAARGADPASPEVQELARRYRELIDGFTMGDPEIEAGLASSYQAPDSPWEKPFNQEEAAFVDRAIKASRGR